MSIAIRVHEHGGPEALRVESVEVGDPGPNEARVRQVAIGVNFIDVYHRTGYYPQPAPFVPGVEGAGVVEAVGAEVRSVKVGDRVAYAGPIGAYASVRLAPADRLVKLPPSISFETAAGAMLQGMTAQILLRKVVKIKAGDAVLIHAAAGGTGMIMCQWAAALGATVIGTVSSEAKAEVARANGCAHVIVYTQQDFAREVERITQGEKLPVVYDSVGKDTFLRSLDCLRPRGLMVTFGQSSGPIDPISPILLSQKGSLYLTRPFLFDYIAGRSNLEGAARDLFSAIVSGKIRPAVNQSYPLHDAARAHQDMERRATTGSSILRV